MTTDLMDKVARKQLKPNAGNFAIGDTVDVQVKIIEGERERLQVFSGTVIARKGSGINESFTVRRIVNNEGVERIFPLHSPNIITVKVKRSGHTRRSKLYFLRDRTGKATRLREKWEGKDVSKKSR
jgi:large subunit ribosomal protein L19